MTCSEYDWIVLVVIALYFTMFTILVPYVEASKLQHPTCHSYGNSSAARKLIERCQVSSGQWSSKKKKCVRVALGVPRLEDGHTILPVKILKVYGRNDRTKGNSSTPFLNFVETGDKKGIHPVLILGTWRHTTESVCDHDYISH